MYFPQRKDDLKIAIVHDWLVTDGGAEKVLKSLLELFPEADVFCIVDFLSDEQRHTILNGKQTNVSFVQRLPFSNPHFRKYMSLFPKAIESFNLKNYDLVISSSWAFAKGAKTHSNQIHICYCYTPIRYAWDMFTEYTQHLPWYIKPFVVHSLDYFRKWDIASLPRVNHFLAISDFIQERIKRTYHRNSKVIYPPVNTDFFTLHTQKEDFYLTASRLVAYKKTALIVEAFNELQKPLVVIGQGQEYEKIKKLAKSNIQVLGYQDNIILKNYMQKAKGFVYAAIEDFGISPLEAMSCGTPVIALEKGGTKETVISKETGLFFNKQTTESIIEAVNCFEKIQFDAKKIRSHAEQFSLSNFKQSFQQEVRDIVHSKNI